MTNIVTATSIVQGVSLVKLSTTSATLILDNPASSGSTIMITSIIITNEDTTNTTNITVSRYNQDAIGGTAYPLLNQIDISPGSPFQLLEHPIFLEEDRSIGAQAEVANDMLVQIDYVVIS